MKKQFAYYLFEGLLIIFSVLLALFLNNYVQQQRLEERKEVALESIRQELKNNLAVAEKWNIRHDSLYRRIYQLTEGQMPQLKSKLKNEPYLKFSILTKGKNFVDATLVKTAWESARSTNVVTDFNYDLVKVLTEAYTLQDIVINNTLPDMADFFFQRATHNMDDLDTTLLQLRLFLGELVGQENLLLLAYEDALRTLEQR